MNWAQDRNPLARISVAQTPLKGVRFAAAAFGFILVPLPA
jgi:hypothetical protein